MVLIIPKVVLLTYSTLILCRRVIVSHAAVPIGVCSSIRSKRLMVSSCVYSLLPALRPPPCLLLPCFFKRRWSRSRSWSRRWCWNVGPYVRNSILEDHPSSGLHCVVDQMVQAFLLVRVARIVFVLELKSLEFATTAWVASVGAKESHSQRTAEVSCPSHSSSCEWQQGRFMVVVIN